MWLTQENTMLFIKHTWTQLQQKNREKLIWPTIITNYKYVIPETTNV